MSIGGSQASSGLPTDASPGAASICIGCGLCCDGTLHGITRVTKSDEGAVAAAGLEIGEEDGKRFFRQPCRHFRNGCCGIYAQRPPVCRSYKCALLKKVEGGTITADEARQKIARAKHLIESIRDWTAEANTPSQRARLEKRLQEELAESAGDKRDSVLKKLLDLGVLRHILTRSFYNEKSDGDEAQGKMSDEPAMTS